MSDLTDYEYIAFEICTSNSRVLLGLLIQSPDHNGALQLASDIMNYYY